jgi:ABC-type uncharacterized transport system involved in gliding motility auxiliary subunit
LVRSRRGLFVEVVEIFGVPFDQRIALDDRTRAGLLSYPVECRPRRAALANQVAAGAGPCC